MPRKRDQVKIIQTEDPVAAEIIADSIVQIAEAVRVMENTRLTRRAIVALIHEHSKVSKGQIELVLNNLSSLESIWLKKRM